MFSSSSRYLIKEGFVNVWANRLMSIASISVLACCLLLMSTASLASVNINSIMDWVEGKNVIMMYLSDNATDERIAQIKTEIENCGNIRSIDFISKEDAFEEWVTKLGGDIGVLADIQQEGENPLPDAYKITIKNLNDYDITLSRLAKIADVLQINDKREYAGKLEKISLAINVISITLVIILFLVSLFIITNTVRLTMFVRKLEISIMKSVGATNTFIRVPFMVEGVLIGIISGIISFGITYVIYRLAVKALSQVISYGLVSFSDVSIWFLLLNIIAGVVIGVVGSSISITRYLKREGGIYLD
ncbi:MAG: permease-like cell division protein FtsX [Clostridia bacterium]|nr:permease-like cell division protein FtsX [Clostridia bacterium]